LLRRSTLIAAALLAAGCATAPPPPAPAPPPPVVSEPEPEPAPLVLEPMVPRAMPAFALSAGPDLEPLPPPVGDLWERNRRGYGIPDIEGPLVEKWEQWYASRPDYVARMVERSRRYLYHIVTEVSARACRWRSRCADGRERVQPCRSVDGARRGHLAIHSLDRQALRARAELLVRLASRRARRDRQGARVPEQAARRLRRLAAGARRLQLGRGQRRARDREEQAKGLPTTYVGAVHAAETANYLPKLQAVKNIVRDPEKYGLALADIPDAPFFTVVKVTKKMDTKHAAEIAELSLEEFLALNPQHNRPVIAGADEQSILLPIDNAEIFAAKLQLGGDQPLVSWQAYG
jgi:membrane-bound lytic murein transglycosylase D